LDERTPLLERLKFLAIFSTNLDEFFMIRVAGLKEQIAEGIREKSRDGMTAQEQLHAIRKCLRPMLAEQMRCLHNEVLPQLAEHDIKLVSIKDLRRDEKKNLENYFLQNIFPVLTPQAVDVSHPFPYVSNLSLNIGLIVEPDPEYDHGKLGYLFKKNRFVRIKLPPNVPRLIPVSDGETRFALLGELVAENVRYLFPNMLTNKCHLFRLTRDADLELREDEAGDILRTMERELHHQRRFSFPVRLEVAASMPDEMIKNLTKSTGVTDDVYRLEGFLNIPDLMTLYLKRLNSDGVLAKTLTLLLSAGTLTASKLLRVILVLHRRSKPVLTLTATAKPTFPFFVRATVIGISTKAPPDSKH
jgi:polyphosphate kinase